VYKIVCVGFSNRYEENRKKVTIFVVVGVKKKLSYIKIEWKRDTISFWKEENLCVFGKSYKLEQKKLLHTQGEFKIEKVHHFEFEEKWKLNW
jgi:hypothetical protein